MKGPMLLILIELILRDPGRQMCNQLVGGERVDGPDFAGSALSVKLHGCSRPPPSPTLPTKRTPILCLLNQCWMKHTLNLENWVLRNTFPGIWILKLNPCWNKPRVPRCQEVQYFLPFFQYHPLSSIKFRLPVKLHWLGVDRIPTLFRNQLCDWTLRGVVGKPCIHWQKQDTGVIYIYIYTYLHSTNPVFRLTKDAFYTRLWWKTLAVVIPTQSHVGPSLGWTSSQTQKGNMLESTQVAHFRLWSLNLKSQFNDL